MTRIKSLCVFCGSRAGTEPMYREAAMRLGALMAERRVRLVYGGGSIGLMGVIADTILEAGGEVTGVIPDFLMQREVGHGHLTQLVLTDSMHDRKRRMFEMADGFVVLPGGLGTLDETFEIITWKQLHLHDAPIVILDVGGYWTPLRTLIDRIIAAEFADPAIRSLGTFVATADAVFPALETAPSSGGVVSSSHL